MTKTQESSLAAREQRVGAMIMVVRNDANNEKCVYQDMNAITQKVQEGIVKLRRGSEMDELTSECFLEGVHLISHHVAGLRVAYRDLPLFHPLRREAKDEIVRAKAILRGAHRTIKKNEHQQAEAFEKMAEEYKQHNWFPLDKPTRTALTFLGGGIMAFSLLFDSLAITELPIPDSIRNGIAGIGIVAFLLGSSGKVAKFVVSGVEGTERAIDRLHAKARNARLQKERREAIERREFEELTVTTEPVVIVGEKLR